MNETIPVVWSLCKIMPAYKKVSNVIINVITKPPIPAISQVTGSIGVSRIVLLITIVKHVKANANNDIITKGHPFNIYFKSLIVISHSCFN